MRQYTEFALLLRKDKCVSKWHSASHMCIHGWRLAASEGLEHGNQLQCACYCDVYLWHGVTGCKFSKLSIHGATKFISYIIM